MAREKAENAHVNLDDAPTVNPAQQAQPTGRAHCKAVVTSYGNAERIDPRGETGHEVETATHNGLSRWFVRT